MKSAYFGMMLASVIASLFVCSTAQVISEGKAITKFNEKTGYLIQGKIDNKNMTSLPFSDIELVMTGPAGFRKNAFANYKGSF